jgi:serine/threonine protein kinase
MSLPSDPVNADRWRIATAIFHAALERPPDRRPSFLAEACREDQSLRANVEALLAGDERANAAGDPLAVDPARALFPDVPTLDVATQTRADSEAAPATPMEGRHFGAYRILHEIGSGGMGSVYLANRVDETFHQRVAIKIVRPGFADAKITGRFRQEREILAALDHPTIARLIDGGSTDEGVPYFVMEYADGQPIDAWCDRHKADVTRRLELFRAVCSGVQHAHDHLVLHRDLKPANIFVTADGGVKLLDFGIAKLLAQPAFPGASTNTGTAMRVMTPRYASPEQVRGEPLSVTSDVYTLGVVLYELLTGHWPYRTQSRLLHEVTRAICEEEPTVPSTVVDQVDQVPSDTETPHPLTPEMISAVREGAPVRLRRRLEGDLDKILLKALAKDPVRRYRSVEQFSEDLRRHLEGMPVAAREDSYWYRASKFVRRHPVGVAAAILIAIAQQFSFMTTVWEFRVKVPAAAAAGAAVDVRPELVAYTYLVLALLVGAAYVSRAQTLRVAGSIVGGAIFSLFVTVVPISMGWRRFVPLEHSVQALWLLCAICIPFGAILALASWRIARRFGWRGLAAFVIVASIGAPIRERLYLSAAHLMVVAPGAVPGIAYTLSWACALLLSHSIMRLMAGPAVDDRLARRRWINP